MFNTVYFKNVFVFRKIRMTKYFTYRILTLITALIFIVALIISISGCMGTGDSSQTEDGLKIVGSSLTIGAVDGVNDTSIQVYSYDFELYNSGNEKIYLDFAEPLFTKDFLARELTEDPKIIINETINPYSTIQIKGQIKFNSSALSKEQILDLQPFIYSINITSTKTLPFPKRSP
jgi:hypothetical protein